MAGSIRAVFLDCGDTLVDEASEVKTPDGVSLRADLIPTAADLVRSLKLRGYPLALVADGPTATFRNNLIPYGLYDLFDAFAISEEVGAEKPDARMFQTALDRLHIARGDQAHVVMLGNNLARDIAGAKALGLIAVWLDWAPRRAKTPANVLETPDYTIKLPIELLELLPQIEQR